MSEHNKKDWGKFQEENKVEEVMGEEEPVEELQQEDAALDHPSYSALEEKLTLAEQKAHESWEKSVRAQAELDNVRRRMDRDADSTN